MEIPDQKKYLLVENQRLAHQKMIQLHQEYLLEKNQKHQVYSQVFR